MSSSPHKIKGTSPTPCSSTSISCQSESGSNDLDGCLKYYHNRTLVQMARGKTNDSGGSSAIAKWEYEIECYYVQLLQEHKEVGNLSKNNINACVFEDVRNRLNMRFCHKSYDCDQVKRKYYSFMRVARLFKEIGNQTGVGWNETLKCFSAPDYVWRYYGQDKDISLIKNRPSDHYWNLVELFEDIGALGTYGQSSNDPPVTGEEARSRQMNYGRNVGDCTIGTEGSMPGLEIPIDVDAENCDAVSDEEPQRRGGKKGKQKNSRGTSSVQEGSRSLSDKRKRDEIYDRAYEEFGLAAKAKREYYSSKSGSYNSPDPNSQDSAANCVKEVDKLKTFLLEGQANKAYGFFKEDVWRQMFIAMSPDQRISWINSL